MEKTKKDAQGAIIKVFVLAAVTLGFIGGFALSGELKERFYRAGDSTKKTTESSDVMIAGGTGNKTLGFDEKYVVSNDDLDYTVNLGTYAGSTDAYFTLEYGSTNKDLKVTKYSYNNGESQEYTMSFVGNVVDVFLGQFNDDPNSNALFYLLENGDVCYSLIEEMVLNNKYGSYYTINDLSNVVKFYNGNSCNPETGSCKSTTFAQSKDGKIYNLSSFIK